MADVIKCNNTLCPHKDKCARYSPSANAMFVPIGKQTKVLPAQRICDMYIPKTAE